MEKNFIGKFISKGHNSVKDVGGVIVLQKKNSAHRLMVVYIGTKFHENMLDGIRV